MKEEFVEYCKQFFKYFKNIRSKYYINIIVIIEMGLIAEQLKKPKPKQKMTS